MTKNLTPSRRVAMALVVALLGVVPGLIPGALGASANPEAKEAELKQVRGRIDSIRKSIQADAERRDSLAASLKDVELDVQSARERLAEVRERRQAAEARLKALAEERVETEGKVAAERDALASELRIAYLNGRQEQVKLLLNQRDPAQLGRVMTYYGYFGRARAERITSISEHLAHLDLLAENIAAETRKLQAIETDNATQVKALASARDRRKSTLAEVQSKIRTRSDQLARLERDAQSLEKLVEQLRKAIEEFPDLGDGPFQRARGKLPWPVKGDVLARFGQLRAGGPLKWQGLVIGADRGTQVRAPFPGRVVYADWLPGLGLLIVLDHGGGFMTLYGHNEQLYRRVGERVAPGDALSAVGDVAGFGKTGLYLEIRKGRQAIDPGTWLTKP